MHVWGFVCVNQSTGTSCILGHMNFDSYYEVITIFNIVILSSTEIVIPYVWMHWVGCSVISSGVEHELEGIYSVHLVFFERPSPRHLSEGLLMALTI